MNKLMKKKKKGFTLIELIAVIAILAILAAIAVPRVIAYVDKSKKTAVQTTATTIYNAAEAAYNDGTLDPATSDKGTTSLTDQQKFENITIQNAISKLQEKNLLSNVKTSQLGDLYNSGHLSDLKNLMNTPVAKISTNGDGDYNGSVPVPVPSR